jgi:hypothetical protein
MICVEVFFLPQLLGVWQWRKSTCNLGAPQKLSGTRIVDRTTAARDKPVSGWVCTSADTTCRCYLALRHHTPSFVLMSACLDCGQMNQGSRPHAPIRAAHLLDWRPPPLLQPGH